MNSTKNALCDLSFWNSSLLLIPPPKTQTIKLKRPQNIGRDISVCKSSNLHDKAYINREYATPLDHKGFNFPKHSLSNATRIVFR